MCRTLQPSAVQVHGGSPSLAHALHRKLRDVPIIRAVDARSGDASNSAVEASKIFDAVLLDSSAGEKWGGTGIVHNWELSRDIGRAIHPRPLILAGGLTPSNIEEAVRLVQPYAVDVSSGVELSPGMKDPGKIFEFVEKARSVSL
jgi:phosphoribosylanthranilate isomerase